MFLLEMGLGVILPVVLLLFRRVRTTERGLVVGAFFAVLGFVMHRLNVSVTGMERAAGTRYLPSFMEVSVSLGLVALGFAVFALAVRTLPVFPHAGSPGGEAEGGEAPGGEAEGGAGEGTRALAAPGS
jgi:Ni/Fe-hydrogenase subunit HybB-like protein